MFETYLLSFYILNVLPFVQSEKLITISKSTIIILIWFQLLSLCVCFCSFFIFVRRIHFLSHFLAIFRSLSAPFALPLLLFLSVFTGFHNDVSPNVWLCHKRKSLNWCSRRITFSWEKLSETHVEPKMPSNSEFDFMLNFCRRPWSTLCVALSSLFVFVHSKSDAVFARPLALVHVHFDNEHKIFQWKTSNDNMTQAYFIFLFLPHSFVPLVNS